MTDQPEAPDLSDPPGPSEVPAPPGKTAPHPPGTPASDTSADGAPRWDPAQYLRHSGHRTRPFLDLLARVPELGPRPRVTDLGCGAGDVTALIARRWPGARITGIDTSVPMLDKARAEYGGSTPAGGLLDFHRADAADWVPDDGDPHDLIVSNAALQWVPGHTGRFPVWVRGLRPGGVLAFQVPGNFGAPSHVLMRELAASPRFADALDGVLRHDDAVLEPAAYLEELTALGLEADVWESTYLQLLTGEDPVLDWVMGTGLRPVLTALDGRPALREEFLTAYRDLLREAYPRTGDSTVFPFRRIFTVGRAGG